MATTPLGYPYSVATDQPAGHTQGQSLAEAVDAQPGIGSFTQAEIDAFTAAQKRAGRTIWNSTTSKLQRSDGSTWVDLVIGTDGRLTDARTPTAHASSHASAGSDPVTLAQSQISGLTDALAAKWTTQNAWAAYTVTNAGLTIGNGTLAGKWVKIGKTVHGFVDFTFGTTSAVTGNLTLGMPSTPTNYSVNAYAWALDSGTATFQLFAEPVGASLFLRALVTSGAYASHVATSSTVPFTWTTADAFHVSFTYEEA